jgi:uncharacterized membrane protein YebE (DUF533 family)
MFDARSILDILLNGPGGRPGQGRQPDSGVFKDMLDQLGEQSAAGRQAAPQPAPGARYPQPQPPPAGQQPAPQAPTSGPGGGPGDSMSLEGLLRSILTGALAQSGTPQQGPAGARPAPGEQQGPAVAPEIGQELQDLLRQILQRGASQGGGTRIPVDRLSGEEGPAPVGGLAETMRELLGQAAAGTREGAARIDQATGLSGRAREALGQVTGETPEEIVAKLRQLLADNQLAAGAALGGLGALVLGTSSGRSLAATAVRVGSLALIGGLAYKAYQNYQQGRPVLSSTRPGEKQTLVAAPAGSGFEPGAVTHDAARRYIRAMIAAAAADGRIGAAEQQKILGGLKQAGIEDSAQQFLATEIANPATVEELAQGVASPEEAVQLYTAARIAVDPDTSEERAFLADLAEALGIDDELVAQVDAAARGAAAA